MRSADLEAMLHWVELAIENVEGLEVSRVELVPEARQWKLVVAFSRWEKQN